MMKFLFPFTTFLYFSSLTATIYQTIDTTTLFRCEFSSIHHNRILVDGGRINKVIFPESSVSVKIEDESGQVFIQSLLPYTPPITISIITNEGIIQDVELNFIEKPSEILILQELKPCNEESPLYFQKYDSQKSVSFAPELSNIVEVIISGKCPNYYTFVKEQGCKKMLKKGLSAQVIGKYCSSNETVYAWRVLNTSKCRKNICEQDFNFPGASWIYLDNDTLNKGEGTLVFVSIAYDK